MGMEIIEEVTFIERISLIRNRIKTKKQLANNAFNGIKC